MRDGLPATLLLYRFLMTAARAVGAAAAFLPAQARRKKIPPALASGGASPAFRAPPAPWFGCMAPALAKSPPCCRWSTIFAREGFAVLVTSGTTTSAELAQQRLPAGAVHQFVPLDVPKFAERFLDHWQPGLALFVESDLWPNLVLASAERQIPLVLLNGRLSQRSFSRWSKIPQSIGAVLKRFDLCLAQSSADAERYTRLGGQRVAMTGNLKLDVPAPPAEPARGGDDALRHRWAAGDGRRFHACRRRSGGDGCAPAAAPPLPQSADHHRSAPSASRRRRLRSWRAAAALTPALRSRGEMPDAAERYLRGGYDGRTRPGLPNCAGRIHRRLAGGTWRAEPDRADKAWRGYPAWPACVEFRRYLFRARWRRRRRAGG